MKNSVLLAFTSRRMAVTLLLGFVAGIPLALTAATLQAWMTVEGVNLTTIGLFLLVGIPYTLKFLWSPLMDRYSPPFLGRRRGWLVVCQSGMLVSIIAIASSNPKEHPFFVALFALILAFFSASHDIANDAYRIELLTEKEYGAGSSLYVTGYRLAMIASGGGAMALAQFTSFRTAYLVMGSTMILGILITLCAPEPTLSVRKPSSLRDAFILPLIEFFKRSGAIEMLLFLIIYKLDTNLTIAMTTPFMLKIGFSLVEVGAVIKTFGMLSTIVGAIFGGGIMLRLGIERSLWLFGITQAFAGLTYMALAHIGHSYPVMVAAVTVENVFSGMGIAAQSAFMMKLCDKRFTATQFALLSSFMALSRYVAGAPSGWLAQHFGWEQYYLLCVLAGIPGLLMLLRYKKWTMPAA